MAVADPHRIESPRPRARPRLRLPTGFQVVLALVGLAVAAAVVIPMLRLGAWAWDEYGTGIPSYYWSNVFTDPVMRPILVDTTILVTVSSLLATFVAAVLAWLNERTDASIGAVGRVIPLIPFLMPAIALPLGWLFLASPNAGALNVLLRGGLGKIGIDLETGPLDIYTWQGLIFLYTVFLCGFGYLIISSSMRNLDSGLEEAAALSGAGALRILFFVVLPALRPALITAFLMCLIVAVAMVSVPITIGTGANIHVLSVVIVDNVTNRSPPAYADAFLLGMLMLVPVLLAWGLQRRSASRGHFAVIGGRASMGARVRLGTWRKAVGRAVFLLYAFVAVVLPVLGLAYVSGVEFWSNTWPESWSPVGNIREALEDDVVRGAIRTSFLLGVVTAIALVAVAQILSYGLRIFPRLGQIVDGLAKTPAVIAHVLLATALLVALGGPPFRLGGSIWLLFLAYFIFFVPFASVMTTGAQHEVGRDVVEAAKLSRASDTRTLVSIVTPLTRPALAGAFLLMFVLVSGETNGSLILASTDQPVVGFVMLDLYNFASYPKVASFALLITMVNLTAIAVFMALLGGRRAGRRR